MSVQSGYSGSIKVLVEIGFTSTRTPGPQTYRIQLGLEKYVRQRFLDKPNILTRPASRKT